MYELKFNRIVRFSFKKMVMLMLISLLMIQSISFAEGEKSVNVVLNGESIEFDVSPVIIEGRTLVPVRSIFEALGMHVDWKEDTKTIFGIKGDKMIVLQIGNKAAFTSSGKISLDVPPSIIGDRTMVPVRFIAESIGANVGWNEYTRTVIINTNIE